MFGLGNCLRKPLLGSWVSLGRKSSHWNTRGLFITPLLCRQYNLFCHVYFFFVNLQNSLWSFCICFRSSNKSFSLLVEDKASDDFSYASGCIFLISLGLCKLRITTLSKPSWGLKTSSVSFQALYVSCRRQLSNRRSISFHLFSWCMLEFLSILAWKIWLVGSWWHNEVKSNNPCWWFCCKHLETKNA